MNNEFITIEELSEKLNIKKATLYKWVQNGKLPAIKFGNLWRFKRKDIESWIEEQENNSKNHRKG